MNLRFLLPKQSYFFEYLEEQAWQLKEMAALFYEFGKEFKGFERYSVQAKNIEHRADKITHKIIDSLNATYLTPLDREDIYEITRRIDDIIDLLEDVIHNIYIYQPSSKLPAVEEFGKVILESSQKLAEILIHIKEQKHSELFRSLVRRVHEMEKEGDVIFEKAIVYLFNNNLSPIEIIKWKDIVENMESITDECRAVANTIEGVIIKSS